MIGAILRVARLDKGHAAQGLKPQMCWGKSSHLLTRVKSTWWAPKPSIRGSAIRVRKAPQPTDILLLGHKGRMSVFSFSFFSGYSPLDFERGTMRKPPILKVPLF